MGERKDNNVIYLYDRYCELPKEIKDSLSFGEYIISSRLLDIEDAINKIDFSQ